MTMAFLAYGGLLVLAALAEATLVHRLELAGGRANLVLLLVVAWSLQRGIEEGALAGLAGGLALDMLGGTPFGLYTAILTVIGAVTALGEATLYRGSLALFFGTAVLVTVSYHGALVLALQVLGHELPSFPRLIRSLVPTVLVNAALMPIVFILAQRLFRALSGWRQLEFE
jgi:rod shape-determining protein MreD